MLLPVVLFACDSQTIYNESFDLPNETWAEDDTLETTFEVTDTLHYHNLWLNTRLTETYPFANIYFKVILKGPNNLSKNEIMNFDVADKAGKWLGKGTGDFHSYNFPIYNELSLKKRGKYTLKIVQYMRTESLQGIHDRGVKINLGREIF